MTIDQIRNPLWRFLPHLRLQFHLQHRIREQLLVLLVQLIERVVDTDIGSSPVFASSRLAIEIVFSDHGELGIEGDTDSSISRQLKSSAIVERSHNCADRGISSAPSPCVEEVLGSPGCNFLVKTAYCTSFASCFILSTSFAVFFPFLTISSNSASIVIFPASRSFNLCSAMANRALTDFSPVQSSL